MNTISVLYIINIQSKIKKVNKICFLRQKRRRKLTLFANFVSFEEAPIVYCFIFCSPQTLLIKKHNKQQQPEKK